MANVWSHTRYAVNIVTCLPALPLRVIADHRPIDFGSDDGVAPVPHLFAAMVRVPPGWNAVVKWTLELEKENVDRWMRARSMRDVFAFVPFRSQSVLVSTSPKLMGAVAMSSALSLSPLMF